MKAKTDKDTEREEDWQPVEVRKPAKASAVYSIRFTGSELAGLRSIARLEHIRISDIVHRAIDFYLTASEGLTIKAGSPGGRISSHLYGEPGSETTALKDNPAPEWVSAT